LSRARCPAGSAAIAAGTASEKYCAPWLPPNTRRRNSPPGSGGEYGMAAASITAGRTGLPVTTILPAYDPSAGRNPPAMASTRAASALLARPITAFCSWMTVGTPRRVAA
jgi:hypothetical protein